MEKPMRVLQVVTHMERGGLETMLMNYYRSIDREKVQFDFLVHRQERAAYDDEIEALGGRIYRLPRLVPWSISYNRTLDTFFGEHKEYCIVHVHQDCLSSVILKAAKKHGVPVRIAHSHTANQDKNIKYLIKLFYKRFIPRYSTDLFACSKQAGDWMFSGAHFQVLKNAIETNLYRFNSATRERVRKDLGISEDTMVVGHVGRFSPPKNHDFLVNIFAETLKIESDTRLLLVGDGELRSRIEEKVRALGIAEKVIFTGVRSDVPDLMQAMDVFLFPSLYEGLGIVLIEAQAAGVPCVISNSMPEACDITNLISRCDLAEDLKVWVQAICGHKVSVHGDMFSEIANTRGDDALQAIRNAGYDIKSNATWLQNYYLGEIR